SNCGRHEPDGAWRAVRCQAEPGNEETGMHLHERCRNIEMLVMDVDGVLTDGSIVYTDQGTEIKAFHVRDGSGLKVWLSLGKKAGMLTGRASSLVTRRAAELEQTFVEQKADDKLAAFRRLMAAHDVPEAQAAYIGDDLPDVPVFGCCGLAAAVADACPEAR